MTGLKEVWAKALAIATMLQAKKEQRTSHGIIFEASEKEIFEIDLNRLEDLATASFHMGTNLGRRLDGLKKSSKKVREQIFFSLPTGFANWRMSRNGIHPRQRVGPEPNPSAFSSARMQQK
jgi:hypothetical protein